MRNIIFRGKATEDYDTGTDGIEKGDWVEGYCYFSFEHNCWMIITRLGAECGGVGSGLVEVHVCVDYKTVGQYTGQRDKNGKGKEIHEDDICKYLDDSNTQQTGIVEYSEIACGYYIIAIGGDEEGNQDIQLHVDYNIEIIGSRHDNPEVLTK